MLTALLCTGMAVPNSSVVTRRDLLERIGGISEDRQLISVEDYDTWIRLAQVTERFHRVPGCLGYYWAGGGNISAASPKQIDRIRALYGRYLEGLSPAVRSAASGFLAYRVGRIAANCGENGIARENLMEAVRAPIPPLYRLKAAALLGATLVRAGRA
jgi:hypothetical protein